MRTLSLLLLAVLPALAFADGCFKDTGYCYTERNLTKKSKAFVVLGDSFSDFSNAWTASKQTFPEPTHGYWMGRFTNGPMWVEHVGEITGAAIIDTANSGSTAADPLLVNGQLNSGISFPIPDLDAQADMLIKKYKNTLKKRSVTYLWAGTADISYLIMSVLGLSGPNTTTAGQIDGPTAFGKAMAIPAAIGGTAEKLLKAGFTDKVILSTIQPIEIQPIWHYGIGMMPEEYRAGAFALIQGLVQQTNAGIWEQAKALSAKHPKANIQVFDAYSFYYRAKATAGLFNITEVVDCCVISAPVPVLPTDLSATEIASTCTNPNNYMFWDSSHPSAAYHAILGAHIADVVRILGF